MNYYKKYSYLFITIFFGVLIWFIKIYENIFSISLVQYGIYPREFSGLKGIVFAPLIHGDLKHLTSNTIPLFIFILALFYFYKTSSLNIFVFIYLISNSLLWILGRSAYHIGASGLIYGFAAFFFFSGIIRGNKRDITLSLLVTFLYGGLVWGILPLNNYISWDGHLLGAITGIVTAFIFKNKDAAPKYDWEDEDTSNDKLEINYDE